MLKKLKRTPPIARMYLLLAAFLLALPALSRIEIHSGRLLVATPLIEREPFQHSVVYLVNQSFGQAYGYILNKPIPDQAEPVHKGGPVAYNEHERIAYIAGDGSLHFLKREEKPAQGMTRLFVVKGFSGWAPIQLNMEMLRGRWNIIDYDPEFLEDTDTWLMWKRAREKLVDSSTTAPDQRI